ncbi:MAG TPA: TIGR03809 family protein [Pseudolabrys sp.]|nr:TIGR03809 family protein [Pseudolabrys sp.]
MPAPPGVPRLDELSRKWLDLAERRLAYFTELYRCGRWRRYYTPEQFAKRVEDVMTAVKAWRGLSGAPPEKPSDDKLKHPAE